MKSNVCKLEQGSHDLEMIFKESEKVASYNGLSQKQAMQLRLLCEEVDGLLPQIIDDFEGSLWIDFEDGLCKVNASIRVAEMTVNKKEAFIELAKDKKNARAAGLLGKIRSGIEDFFLADETMIGYPIASGQFHLATGYSDGVDYAYIWSLEQYRTSIDPQEQEEEWDELEKSLIASVADDVTVGVKGKQVDIVITKRFS